MDKIFNKIIKYGGVWSQNVFSLGKSIEVADTTIHVLYGSERFELIDGDILKMEIDSVVFIVEYCRSTPDELKILLSTSRTRSISQLTPVYTLIHLKSSSPEELPTNFELNRIVKKLKSTPEVHIIAVPSNVTEGRINVSTTRNNRQFKLELLETDGSEVFTSELTYLDEVAYIHWYSMTRIPSGVFILTFLPD